MKGGARRAGAARVLIVDDHPLVRAGLRDLLGQEKDLEVCGEAGDAPTALRQVERLVPEIAVIDLSLEEGSGLELVKQLRKSHPGVRILVSSMYDERIYAQRALSAGAMGYVEKQEPVERLLDGIRSVLQGKTFVSEAMAERMERRYTERERKAASPIESLSDRELEVLQLIGEGLTTREVASRLNLSTKTIDTYRDHLKTKLNLASSTELVRYAVAWVLEGQQTD